MNKNLAGVFSLLHSLNEAVVNLHDHSDVQAYMVQQGDTFMQVIEAVTNHCREYSLLIEPQEKVYRHPDHRTLHNAIKQLQEDAASFPLFIKLFEAWFYACLPILTDYATQQYPFRTSLLKIDRDFANVIDMIQNSSEEQLFDFTMGHLKKIRDEKPEFYKKLTVEYRGWYFPGNWLDGTEGENNSLIINRIQVLKNLIHKFIWFYGKLEDYRSRETLLAIILNWLTFSMDECKRVADYSGRLCCDPDIFKFEKEEVFVDAGAYIGDTVVEFVNLCGRDYKKIYVYDISKETIDCLEKNLAMLPNVVVNWKGVSDKKGQLNLCGVASPFHGNRLVEEKGIYNVDVVTIDEDVPEPVTFLKVDVEGLDKETLVGAANHIRKDKPKIVVDAYHKLEDIVEIPFLIQSINSHYKFYLRLPASDIQFAVGYALFFT